MVGRPEIEKNRPPAINRSRATAKTPTLKYSLDEIDRVNPAAYKNNTWKYYLYLTKHHIVFANTKNGQPYEIHKKTGTRIPFPAARLGYIPGPLQGMKPRKPNFHTWNAYQKRAMRDVKLRSGEAGHQAAYNAVSRKVNAFVNGNNRALNTVPLSTLVWWSQKANRMTANGQPYVKINGKWHRYGGNVVTRNNVLNNIRMAYS
jgi:hypothetical protein